MVSILRGRIPVVTGVTCLALAVSASAAFGAGPPLGSTGHIPVNGKSCGDFPAGPVKDPQHVLHLLPQAEQALYAGLPYTIGKSAWTNWKPPKPPWTIGILDGPLEQPNNQSLKRDYTFWMKQLMKEGLVKKYIFLAAPDYTVASQIPQFNSLIQRHVNLIMVEPNSTTALLPEVTAAGKAGIPTVTTSGVIQSPYAMNFANNAWMNGAVPTAYIAYNYMHSKGNILTLTGAPTQPTAIAGVQGAEAALKNCPNIKVVNPAPLNSQYSNSVAKSVVLQFLASYSGTINGVFDGGVVSTGVIGAFRQLGKPVPAVTNLGMIDGGLAYWAQNPSSFGSAATGSGGYEYDRVTVDMGIRLLEGKGPKLNTIIAGYCDLITPKNLKQLAAFNKSILGSAFNINNINVGDVPPFTVRNAAQMNGYFNKSGLKGPVGLDSGNLPGLVSLLRQP